MTRPQHINPLQWTEAIGLARQACAGIFRKGGSPKDALAAFGLPAHGPSLSDWSKTVEAIAASLCSTLRQAA